MGAFSLWHWMVVVCVAMAALAPSRLIRNMKEAGKATKAFKGQ
jgi:Sec-independent protein translocase protein TatA